MVKEICIIGDSIVWGKKDIQGGWANRLRNFFNKDIGQEGRALVYPLGIAGDDTNFALERIENEFDARDASVVIFALGANDCRTDKKYKNHIGRDRFKENLEKMISIAKKFTESIIFIGIVEVNESKTTPVYWIQDKGYYKNSEIRIYNKILEDFCKEKGITFIPMQNVLDIKKDLYDGIHPNARGHEKIFKRVLPVVERIIKS